MKKKKVIKMSLAVIIIGIITAGSVGFYLFNMPHRNVQASDSDYTLSVGQLISEYLSDPFTANEKYLADDGDSKILEISGQVASISEDYNLQKVVLLKSSDDKAGVSCTFTKETNESLNEVKPGQHITVKGVIRSGAFFDEDLEMYENVIVEKCAIISTL